MPHECLKGLTVKLPKKGNLKESTNWRGITLLVIASKVLGKILIERLKSGADKRLRAEQAGFRQGKNTRAVAKDRDKWKKSSAALCATERKEDR